MSDAFEVRKYLFDLAFDEEPGAACDVTTHKQTYTHEQLEAAQKEAFDQGLATGKKSVLESQQQAGNMLLAEIEGKLAAMQQNMADVWQKQLKHMQGIALVIARKIIPAYVASHGLDEIEAIISKTIAEMNREPRLVIRVSETEFDDASARINTITEKQAFAGKVVILGEPELGKSECRIEWADGGIERDIKVLWEDIERVMDEVQSAPVLAETPTPTNTPSPSSIPSDESGATT